MMKKMLLASALLCAALGAVSAQEGASGGTRFSTDYVVKKYDGVRIEKNGTARGVSKYTDDISLEDEELFGGLDGGFVINKPHELIAATAVLNIKEVVPADALKVYAEIAMEGAANSFLGVTGTTHTQVLKRLNTKYNFTKEEIDGAIRATVAAAVDAEFNKVEFLLTTSMSKSYNAILTRDAKTGYYKLSYERPSVENDDKELSAPTLDALKAEMRKNRADFDETGIRSVETNAALMPARTQIKGSKVASSVLFTEIVTGFYTAKIPADQNRYYKALLGFNFRLRDISWYGQGDYSAMPIIFSSISTLEAISLELARKSDLDLQSISNLADLSNEVDRVENLIPLR